MFHIILICEGLPAVSGPESARTITQDFAAHRTWHAFVTCEWESNRLVLRAENDFDEDGTETRDEFSECISEHVIQPGDFSIAIQSVSESSDDN
jgi:hypothetical protein